jgi:hypothetical protein
MSNKTEQISTRAKLQFMRDSGQISKREFAYAKDLATGKKREPLKIAFYATGLVLINIAVTVSIVAVAF